MRLSRIAALFPILAFSYAMKSVNGFLPEPLPVFKDQSTFFGYTNGNQRVDHIFNLLADVPQASEVTALEKDLPQASEVTALEKDVPQASEVTALEKDVPQASEVTTLKKDQLHFQPARVHTEDFIRELEEDRNFQYNNAIDDNSIVYNEEVDNEIDGGSTTYMDMLRSFAKKSLHATKKVKDVFDTVQKVTRIYQDERRKIVQNATALKQIGLENEPQYDPNTSTATTLLNVALDPPSLIRMVEVSRSSTSEDDILECLTAVLLGAEARSGGSALTLDPVTIIALLTLAAYLIRAVYQILANNTGRSMATALDGLPLGLSGLPDLMATVHDYISGADYTRESYARSLQESEGNPNSVQGLVALPGSLAAFTKLIREGHQGCARLYVCDQLAARSLFSYSFEDIVVAGLGYYYADADLWRLVGRAHGDEGDSGDACAPYHARCGQDTLAEARRIRDLFTEASSKLVRFWGATTVAKRRSLARAATSGGAQTVDTN